MTKYEESPQRLNTSGKRILISLSTPDEYIPAFQEAVSRSKFILDLTCRHVIMSSEMALHIGNRNETVIVTPKIKKAFCFT